ncbi:hypothetical protein APHAL10511_005816 [Amanita phalloides]|nr:hypothetical protein APHAL10511_005816 [Amanita phalloides]
MELAYAEEIKGVLQHLLGRLEIQFEISDFDHQFDSACRRAARDRGIALDGDAPHIGSYISVGVALATTAYAHLPSDDSRIYIALFTAALAAVQDVCRNEYEPLKAFCSRYLQGKKHGHPILDCYAMILRELPDRYRLVVADMMLQSNMDFITALVLEHDMQDRPMSSSARGFPVFLRDMSGASKIYSLLAYPKEIPLLSYVEAIPASMTYVNFMGDIFSFYQKELVHETDNCISHMARCNGQTKSQVLQELADKSVEAHKEAIAVLSNAPEALKAFERFSRGYVHFHTSSPRYKVADLWSMGTSSGPSRVHWPSVFIYTMSTVFIIIVSIYLQSNKSSLLFLFAYR